MPVSLKHPDRPDPSEVAAMALREYTPEHLTDEIYPQNSERVYTPIHQTEEKLPVDLSRECTPIHITSEEKQIHAAAPEDPEPADVSKSDNSVVTYSNYISHSSDAWLSYDGYTFLNELFTPDKLSTISITDIDDQFFTDTYSGDLGYIASASPIPMDNPIPDVEPDKIDPDATVKMTGDTIYDYTITNTTGDTTTFNEYVTNNYTYITSRCNARCWNCFGGYRAHPILDCDFFYFKMFPKYRIKRIYCKPEIRYVDKTNADDIRIMLTEILRIISADERARSDINCVRNKCLCLSCPIFSSCSDRCSLCHDYPGQRPVKLCGKRLQIER